MDLSGFSLIWGLGATDYVTGGLFYQIIELSSFKKLTWTFVHFCRSNNLGAR